MHHNIDMLQEIWPILVLNSTHLPSIRERAVVPMDSPCQYHLILSVLETPSNGLVHYVAAPITRNVLTFPAKVSLMENGLVGQPGLMRMNTVLMLDITSIQDQ